MCDNLFDNLQVTTFLSINISTLLLGSHNLMSIYTSFLRNCFEVKRRLRRIQVSLIETSFSDKTPGSRK